MNTVQELDNRRGFTSASNAMADALCAGRHLAQQGIPEPPPGEYATTGQRIHDALAQTLRVEELTADERETFDNIRALEKSLLNDYFGEQPPNPVRPFREQRFWVKFSKGDKTYQHSGKPDVVFRSGTRVLILEYKTLFGDIPISPTNLQLRDQAVLVRGNMTLIEEIAVAVIQPHVTMKPEITAYDKEALERSTIEMYERVVASNTINAPRVAGEVQCQHCLAKRYCQQYTAWAGSAVPMLKTLDVPMGNWTPEQRQVVMDAIGPAEKFLADIKEFMKLGCAQDAAFLPGWELKPGNTVESIVDPQKALDRFVTMGGKLEDFMPSIKVSKTALKEAVHQVTSKKGKVLEELMKQITEGIVEVKQNAPSLRRIKE